MTSTDLGADFPAESEEVLVFLNGGTDFQDHDGYRQAGIPIDYSLKDFPKRMGTKNKNKFYPAFHPHIHIHIQIPPNSGVRLRRSVPQVH